jgi:hypothetical protein
MGNQRGFALLLGIQLINTTTRAVPLDLNRVAFDSTTTRSRFHKLTDAIKPIATSHIRYISIGNEVDVYLGAHPGEWDPNRAFRSDSIAYVHQVLPGVKVGVTTTFGGSHGPDARRIAGLNALADVVVMTYPLGADFRPPESVNSGGGHRGDGRDRRLEAAGFCRRSAMRRPRCSAVSEATQA